MKQLFKSEGFQYAIYALGVVAVVKLLWFMVTIILLPNTTQELESQGDIKPLYYRLSLAKKDGEAIKPKPKPVTKKPATPISALVLLGVYKSSDNVVVTVKKGSKTTVLSKGESIGGFTLMDASRDEALFEKSGKSYTLKFKKKKRSASSKSIVSTIPTAKKEEPKANVIDDGGIKVVKRDMIKDYMKKPKDIWKDIGISEIKKGKDITGFRVRFVRKDSGFEKLGIKRGDIILAINGERLDSYQDAFGVYKNIQTIENLTLTIKRKNQEMELDYEIK
ncbi:MAG: PDZ domain-containing protein [Campylobacterota bacterium]|nr:PDZ domain-containing protein [Campylobacterota bacterium]